MERQPPRGTAGRLVALAVALGGAAAALAFRAVAVVGTIASPAARVDDWVELVVIAGAALAAAWVAIGAVLGSAVVMAARAGVRWRAGEAAVRALAPGLVRRLVRAGVGAGVGAGLVLSPTAAFAAEPAPHSATVVAEAGAAASGSGHGSGVEARGAAGLPADGGVSTGIDLSWQPTGPVEAPAAASPSAASRSTPASTLADAPTPSLVPPEAEPAAPATPTSPGEVATPGARPVSSPQGDGTVVVLRGDTLWDIAARSLGGTPTDAEVLAATVRWHEANRDVIGDDADVILPGQVLTPPA